MTPAYKVPTRSAGRGETTIKILPGLTGTDAADLFEERFITPNLDARLVRCPDAARHDDDLVGCGSVNVIGPDDEGLYDCCDCGLFFRAEVAR